MSYEQKFLAARKKYLDAVASLKPSGIFDAFVKEERTKILAKTMDDVNGKGYDVMAPAHVAYDTYYKTYHGKIGTQIEKEKVDKGKLKGPLAAYLASMKEISNAFLKDCATKKKAEDEQAKAPPKAGAVDAKAAGANAAAAAANKRNIGLVSAEFKKRREKHLEVAGAVDRKAQESRGQITPLHEALQKGVTTSRNYVMTGNLRGAAGLKIAGLGQLNKIKATSLATKNFYDTSLSPFFAERNMTGKELAGKMGIDIPEEYQGALKAACMKHSAIFTKATALTASAKRLNEECASLVGDAESLLEQITDIADGKDQGKIFLDGATKAAQRISGIVTSAMADAEKLDTGTLVRITGAVQVLTAGQPLDQIESQQGIVNNLTPFLQTTLVECQKAATTARQLLDAELKKIPGEFKAGPPGEALAAVTGDLVKLETLNAKVARLTIAIVQKAQPFL